MNFDATKWLVNFGYMAAGVALDSIMGREAVAKAQASYGLDPTGKLDAMTERVISRTPRCGHPDVLQARGFVPQWSLRHLRYAFQGYPTGLGLSQADVRSIVKRAFGSISAVCGMTFEETTDQLAANLLLGVGRGSRAGFDGPSGVLAWAELPSTGSYASQLQLMWDMDEAWSDDSRVNGILLENVTCHEGCHLMGLDHTQVPGQLMNPYYDRAIRAPQSAWDTPMLVGRYGAAAAPPITPPAPTPSVPPSTPSAGGLVVSKLEAMYRINGQTVLGPFDVDLSKVKAA